MLEAFVIYLLFLRSFCLRIRRFHVPNFIPAFQQSILKFSKLIVPILLVTQSYAKDQPAKETEAALSIPCYQQVSDFLNQHDDQMTSFKKVKQADQSVTHLVGLTNQSYVKIEIFVTNESLVFRRIGLSGSQEYEYEIPTCKKIFSKDSSKFKDTELQGVLDLSKSERNNGIIYVWSPRMNLSIQGLSEIIEIAKSHNYRMTIIRDEFSSEQEAYNVLTEIGLPYQMAKSNGSSLLRSQQAAIHFPIYYVFRNGEIINRKPGYETPPVIAKWISDSLQQNTLRKIDKNNKRDLK